MYSTSTRTAGFEPGLVIKEDKGEPGCLLLSGDEICADVLATIPKIRSALRCVTTFKTKWKGHRSQRAVQVFEMPTTTSTTTIVKPVRGGTTRRGRRSRDLGNPDENLHHLGGREDLDIAHAMLAQTELRCHLNEVLTVLTHHRCNTFSASTRLKAGSAPQPREQHENRELFRQSRQLAGHRPASLCDDNPPTPRPRGADNGTAPSAATNTTDSVRALIGVQLMTLRPAERHSIKRSLRHKRTQKLVFAYCTQRSASGKRALHVMKTLPKHAHDQIVLTEDRSALRRAVDHIVAAFDLQTTAGGYGSGTHVTKVQAYSYAAVVPASEYESESHRAPRATYALTRAQLLRHRASVMNPEAHRVLELLTTSLRELEPVIRRRRLGFQAFIYFPPSTSSASSSSSSKTVPHESCSRCSKPFTLFRRDVFCQLCGHLVCGDCSNLCEVEPRMGQIRQNRCCVACLVRVDQCVYDDAELLLALGPTVVEADDAAWHECYQPDTQPEQETQPTKEENEEPEQYQEPSASAAKSIEALMYSSNPADRSYALERLSQLVTPSVEAANTGRLASCRSKPPHDRDTMSLRHRVEFHVDQRLAASRQQYRRASGCVVHDFERDYAYRFDATQTVSPDSPLVPRPTPYKEEKRLRFLQDAGVVGDGYDHRALDLIAQVAAERLHCPIGFVSVIESTLFRVIGGYNFAEEGLDLSRNEHICAHGLYGEMPLVLKDPQRDLRFANMSNIKDLGAKFYAGFPVYARDGLVVASICVGDLKPHHNISTKDYATMEILSKLAASLISPSPSGRHGIFRKMTEQRPPAPHEPPI